MSAPAVSVVMPVYNAAAYVGMAIRSILEQTFTDLELIVVNDGSTDGSADVIKAFTDPRIRYVEQTNQGVVGALNAGLALCRGALIARQDADDRSLPQRMEKQVAFLNAHPDVGLLGTWAVVTDPEDRPIGNLHHPLTHPLIAYALLFDTALVHPTVMFRRSVLEQVGPYSDDPRIFEDHEMWNRMAQVTHIANLPEELLHYREVPVSASRVTGRQARTMEQRCRNFKRELPNASERMIELLTGSGFAHATVSRADLKQLDMLFSSVIERLGGDATEQRTLRQDVRKRLMAYRLISGDGILQRIADRILKSITLA